MTLLRNAPLHPMIMPHLAAAHAPGQQRSQFVPLTCSESNTNPIDASASGEYGQLGHVDWEEDETCEVGEGGVWWVGDDGVVRMFSHDGGLGFRVSGLGRGGEVVHLWMWRRRAAGTRRLG